MRQLTATRSNPSIVLGFIRRSSSTGSGFAIALPNGRVDWAPAREIVDVYPRRWWGKLLFKALKGVVVMCLDSFGPTETRERADREQGGRCGTPR